MSRLKLLLPVFLLLCIAPLIAQEQSDGSCPAIVQTVIDSLDDICEATGRNEACYGNIDLSAQPRAGVEDFDFDAEGDIEEVIDIEALRLTPLSEDNQTWGVALMRLQANLPDTLPNQNVTFLLFGDVELINAVSEDSEALNPMQAFYLRTGISDAACAEAPESGLLVRTPEGVGQVNFSMNGVDVAVGSSVFFQAPQAQEMITRVYEGSAVMRTPDGDFPIIAGTQRSMPLGEDLMPAGPPSVLQSIPDTAGQSLQPYAVDQPDAPPPPAYNDFQLTAMNNLVGSGAPLCGTLPFLPSCDDLVEAAGGDKCPVDDEGNEICGLPQVGVFNGGDEEIPPFTPPVYDDDINTGEAETGGETEGETSDAGDGDENLSPLPEGCYDGICLEDPAIACQCDLCGVVCPADGDSSTGIDTGDADLDDEEARETEEPAADSGDENNDIAAGLPGGGGDDGTTPDDSDSSTGDGLPTPAPPDNSVPPDDVPLPTDGPPPACGPPDFENCR